MADEADNAPDSKDMGDTGDTTVIQWKPAAPDDRKDSLEGLTTD